MPTPSRKNKYRNNRGGNRSKSIKRIGKSIGKSISGVATYAFNRLTQSKNPVQPIGSSLEINKTIINNPPLRLLTLGTKSKKRQPPGEPPGKLPGKLPTISEDSKESVIDINEITIGHGKTRKPNKNIKRIKKHAQQ